MGDGLKVLVLATAAFLACVPAAWAQSGDFDAAAYPIRQAYANVAQAAGPAWWKVSKGDSIVWIMGTPPTRYRGAFNWDKSVYRRRLWGARVAIVPYGERAIFAKEDVWPALPPDLSKEVEAAYLELGVEFEPDRTFTFGDALQLRDASVVLRGLKATANDDIVEIAKEFGVPMVRVPTPQHTWRAANYPPGDPMIAACTRAILDFARTDPVAFNIANRHWANGEVQKVLQTTPKGFAQLCRRYSPGHREETLAFQTLAVMEALRRPGKAVAVFGIDNLIAEDGILGPVGGQGLHDRRSLPAFVGGQMSPLKTVCIAALSLASLTPALAQTRYSDPEGTVVRDVVVVAPTEGPVWWKVTRGDSTVWIIGLPDSSSSMPANLRWDTRAFQRRIKGARAFLATPDTAVVFPNAWSEILPIDLRARVAVTSAEVGLIPDNYWSPVFGSVVNLRSDFRRKNRFTLDVQKQMVDMARSARTPVSVTQQPSVAMLEEELRLDQPQNMACLLAMLDEVETNPAVLRTGATDWAEGRALAHLASPRGALPVCINRLIPGDSMRQIEERTATIAAALATSGKTVAAASIRQLVAENGIIQRLKAQGFDVSDPSKLLDE